MCNYVTADTHENVLLILANIKRFDQKVSIRLMLTECILMNIHKCSSVCIIHSRFLQSMVLPRITPQYVYSHAHAHDR